MDKNIVFHIGLPKALSTYLQTYVFPEIEDTYYEGMERDNLDDITRVIYNIMSQVSPINFDTKKNKETLNNFLLTIPQKNILVSEELLYGCYFNNFRDSKIILELLKNIFGNIKILLVLRRQDEFVNSLYKQMLKLGYTIRFKNYINFENGELGDYRQWERLNIDVKQINYYNYVKFCYDIFGKENVTVLPYEMYLDDKNSFLNHIYDNTGLPPYYPNDNMIVNRSYSLISSYVALFFNRFFSHHSNTLGFIPQRPFLKKLSKYQGESALIKILRELSSRLSLKYFLTRIDKIYYKEYKFINYKISNEIIKYHRHDNEKLSKIINIDLSKYNYY